MWTTKSISNAGSAVLLAVWAGCAQPKTSPPVTAPAFRAMGQSVGVDEARTDEAIGLETRHRLASEIPGESAGVVVEVSDGVVTLRGYAPSQTAAWRVQAVAHSVKGVKQVIDQMTLKASPLFP